MKISLIGMSGSGKTYWGKKLKEKGFRGKIIVPLPEPKVVTP